MTLENFTPVAALVGGALIGLSASAMLYFQGRIAGISGIVGGLLTPREGDVTWRLTFFAGLLAGGLVMVLAAPDSFAVPAGRSSLAIVGAGLLVGFGTRMGNGCTSGHGVCGLTRLSPRSAVAVGTFMATGAITATVVGSLLGGAL